MQICTVVEFGYRSARHERLLGMAVLPQDKTAKGKFENTKDYNVRRLTTDPRCRSSSHGPPRLNLPPFSSACAACAPSSPKFNCASCMFAGLFVLTQRLGIMAHVSSRRWSRERLPHVRGEQAATHVPPVLFSRYTYVP
jgi:hypothetical protein